MPETEKQKLGREGEDEAAKHLQRRDYKILARNWRPKIWGKTGKGELDIIARKKGVLIFCEVKTLAKPDIAIFSPEDRVNFQKQRKILQTAKLYLMLNKIPQDTPWQIDILGVWYDDAKKNWETRHFENAILE